MARGFLWLVGPGPHRLTLGSVATLFILTLSRGAGAQDIAPDYLIGPGDRLEVIVRGEPELSTTVPVRPDGRLTVPLVGDLLVSGSTTTQVELGIERRLAEYLRSPEVTVIVREAVGLPSQQIRVVGKVVKPQAVPYRAGITVLDVVGTVGGLAPFADGNDAVIIREEGGETRRLPVRLADLLEDGDISANLAMEPGDVLLIPEGYFSGESTTVWSIGLSEAYSDNVDLLPSADADASFITSLAPAVTWRTNLAGLKGGLDANLNLYNQTAGVQEGWNVGGNLIGTVTADLVDDHLFLDASAAATQEILNNRARPSEANLSFVQRYQVSPYLKNRFGGFGTSELRYSYQKVLVNQSGDSAADVLNDTESQTVAYLLGSGRDFTRFFWAVGGLASNENRKELEGAQRRNVNLTAGYPVSPSWSVLGGLGYEVFKDIGTDITGPTWLAGFAWRPSRRTLFEASYGRRDGENSPAFLYRQDITPRVRATARYEERLQTGLERTFAPLESIAISQETQKLVDSVTLLPFSASTPGFSTSALNTRTRQLTATLSAARRRDTFGLTLSAAEQKALVSPNTQRIASAGVNWIRQVGSRLGVNLSADYYRTDSVEASEVDDTYGLGAGASYALGVRWSANLSYAYHQRISNRADAEYTENRISAGLRGSF